MAARDASISAARRASSAPTPGQAAVALERLIAEYGGRWQIERVSIETWTAVDLSQHRRRIRVLVGTPEEERSKLQTAEIVEPD